MPLHLILGPMWAGKSTKLLEYCYDTSGESIVAINSKLNTRYGEGITTHKTPEDGKRYTDVITVNKLATVEEKFKIKLISSTLVIIEELHFYPDAYNCITRWVDTYKLNVVAAGLDGDFRRKPIGDVLRLIPFADSYEKLSARCEKCGRDAPFTKRLTESTRSILPGGEREYMALCRDHYLNLDVKHVIDEEDDEILFLRSKTK